MNESIIPSDANNVRVRAMSNEELSKLVAESYAGILHRIAELRPYFVELWRRFDVLAPGQTITGCKTRTEYCERVLRRSVRSVQYAVYGRQPLAEIADTSEVAKLRASAFARKCIAYDPVLFGLVLAQTECIDMALNAPTHEEMVRFTMAAAKMEGRCLEHIYKCGLYGKAEAADYQARLYDDDDES